MTTKFFSFKIYFKDQVRKFSLEEKNLNSLKILTSELFDIHDNFDFYQIVDGTLFDAKQLKEIPENSNIKLQVVPKPIEIKNELQLQQPQQKSPSTIPTLNVSVPQVFDKAPTTGKEIEKQMEIPIQQQQSQPQSEAQSLNKDDENRKLLEQLQKFQLDLDEKNKKLKLMEEENQKLKAQIGKPVQQQSQPQSEAQSQEQILQQENQPIENEEENHSDEFVVLNPKDLQPTNPFVNKIFEFKKKLIDFFELTPTNENSQQDQNQMQDQPLPEINEEVIKNLNEQLKKMGFQDDEQNLKLIKFHLPFNKGNDNAILEIIDELVHQS